MNNLAEKGRPFVQGGDGMMLVGTQLAVDGKPMGRGGAPPAGASGRRPRSRWPGRRSGGARSASRHVDRSRRCARPATAPSSSARRATWRPPRAAKASGCCPASRWAEYKLPPQTAAARHQSPAGLDSRLQGRRAGRVRIRGRDQVHRVAGARAPSRCAFPASSCGTRTSGASATATKPTSCSSRSSARDGS